MGPPKQPMITIPYVGLSLIVLEVGSILAGYPQHNVVTNIPMSSLQDG